MTNMCAVSIIIPVYNAAGFIEKCAHSLMGQTLKGIQYIFVDDCSTDNSLEVLSNVVGQYPERENEVLIVRHKENRGAASARNTGLAHAGGTYIGWVDADDWVEEEMFEKMLRRAEELKVDMVWCDYMTHRVTYSMLTSNAIPETIDSFLNSLVCSISENMLWNKLLVRDIITTNKLGFSEGLDLGEDRTFLIQYLYHCKSISHLPEACYHYVQLNPSSIVKDGNPKRIYEEIGNAKVIVDFLKEKNVASISEEEINQLKFKSKKRLLYSSQIADLKNWVGIFPEVNTYAFRQGQLVLRHRILVLLLMWRLEWLLRIWTYYKRTINTNS